MVKLGIYNTIEIGRLKPPYIICFHVVAVSLGVIQYKQIPAPGFSNEDLNGFKGNQCRIYGGGVLPVNAPTNSGTRFLIVNEAGYGYVLQKFVSHSGMSATEYARYWDGGSWSAWYQI